MQVFSPAPRWVPVPPLDSGRMAFASACAEPSATGSEIGAGLSTGRNPQPPSTSTGSASILRFRAARAALCLVLYVSPLARRIGGGRAGPARTVPSPSARSSSEANRVAPVWNRERSRFINGFRCVAVFEPVAEGPHAHRRNSAAPFRTTAIIEGSVIISLRGFLGWVAEHGLMLIEFLGVGVYLVHDETLGRSPAPGRHKHPPGRRPLPRCDGHIHNSPA